MRFGVLGPVEVDGGNGPRRVAAAKERRLLAALLARVGTTVPVPILVEALWAEEPPATASKTLQTYVSDLRRAVGADRIVTRPPGYALVLAPGDEIDAGAFVTELARARAVAGDDPAEARAVLAGALARWRGDPFEDVADAVPSAEVARLVDQRAAALELDVELRLVLGQHHDVVEVAAALVDAHPRRERLWAALALAHYRCGRQADALATLHRARSRLVEETGLDPGPELVALERAVLARDPSLDLSRSDRSGSPGTVPTTRYAWGAGAALAYQTVGDGPVDVLFIPDWWSHVEVIWEHAAPRRLLERLGRGRRLVLFDGRGTGLSDPLDPAVEHRLDDWIDDAAVVLDRVGSRRVVAVGSGIGAMAAVGLAAREPALVGAVVLVNACASLEGTLPGRAGREEVTRLATLRWGTGPGLSLVHPTAGADPGFDDWLGRLQRHALSPGRIAPRVAMAYAADVSAVAATLDVPALVAHRRDNPVVPASRGRSLAGLIPGARFVALEGREHLIFAGDIAGLTDVIDDFLVHDARGSRAPTAPVSSS